MPPCTACCSPAFAHVAAVTALRVLSPTWPARCTGRCARGGCLSTPGVLGSDASSAVSRHLCLLRPHRPVPRARDDFTAGPFIRRAFAVRERLGDPRDLPYFSCRTVCACRRPYAGGSAASSRCLWRSNARLPRFTSESPPTTAVSASNTRRVTRFRRCNVRFMLRPVRLPSPPDWLRPDGVTGTPPGPLRYRITPACGATRYRDALGVRLDGRTGNLPSSGLPPDQFPTACMAAQ
jgi:hypothetical protein